MTKGRRMAASSLVLSMAAIVGIVGFEGYRDRAYVPVPGDKVTIAHGTTQYPDGSPVKMGDKVTPQRAMELLQHDTSKFGKAVLKCAPVPMYQHEYDAFVTFTYNLGEGAFCGSSIPKKLAAGDYAGACKSLLDFNKVKDKSKPKVLNQRTGKMDYQLKVLRGLTSRRQAEYKMCMGEKLTQS